MLTQSQYLNKEILIKTIGVHNITTNDLISADTYNETKMLEKFLLFDDKTKTLLYKSSIQLAIIGYGNKNYGSIRHEDEVIKLIDLFNSLKIKYEEKLNAKYSEDEFSARRLLRFFRYQIQEFIKNTGRPSYLWLKYSTKEEKYISICFPGAEHLVENIDDALYLYKTYRKLDEIMSTKFCDRLKRIYIARNLFTPLEVERI